MLNARILCSNIDNSIYITIINVFLSRRGSPYGVHAVKNGVL